jgi:hypothetical protein
MCGFRGTPSPSLHHGKFDWRGAHAL